MKIWPDRTKKPIALQVFTINGGNKKAALT